MEKLGLNEIRQMFRDFYVSKGHYPGKSASLIPQNDKSLLIINSGMAPLKNYFAGVETPPSKRMTTCQKCIRTGDIDNVGITSRHGTFFEMLGNFSFGDYFKEESLAWCPAIRSAAAIRSGAKRCFVDPSIAVAALGMSPRSLELDLRTFGFIFECMCIRDLKVYSQALGGRVSYYHDRYGLEADIVLHLADGRYALIECKLGSREIDDGAKHLLQLRNLIREKNKVEHQMPLREPLRLQQTKC